MAKSASGGQPLYTAEQLGCLFTFIARQMARYESQLLVKKDMFEHVLRYLTDPSTATNHDERQQVRFIAYLTRLLFLFRRNSDVYMYVCLASNRPCLNYCSLAD